MQPVLNRLCQSSLGWLLLGFSGLSQAQDSGPEIYTCIDASGHKLTSDRKIPACNDREQKVLGPSGTVKRLIGPSLTAQELAQTEAKARARQLEQSHQEEDRKRNRALLTRYPNEAEHHKQREEALVQIALVKQAAGLRVDQLKADLTKLQDEMAFYAKDPKKAPTRLRLQIESVTRTLEAQNRFVADKDIEALRVTTRFNDELARLRPLWRLNESPAGQ
jgi:hypothetical protein